MKKAIQPKACEERRKNSEHYEALILDLHATVHNGLTDRTKKTEKMVADIHQEHTELKTDIQLHIASEKQDRALMMQNINELTNQQKQWTKAKNRGLLFTIAVMGSFMSWMLFHSAQIAHFIEHITKIAG